MYLTFQKNEGSHVFELQYFEQKVNLCNKNFTNIIIKLLITLDLQK